MWRGWLERTEDAAVREFALPRMSREHALLSL